MKEEYLKKIEEYKKIIKNTNSIYIKRDYAKAIKKIQKKLRSC